MKISVLASGSKGNCVYIEGSSGAILVDAGRSGREILGSKQKPGRLEEAGGRKELVEGLLITHEHIDHIRGLSALSKNLKVPVYGTSGTLDSCVHQNTSSFSPDMHTVRTGNSYQIGDFLVEPFLVSHDACEPCGYLISEGSTTLCYCTDTGVVTDSMLEVMSRADGMVLESNHSPEMLRNGPYPLFLKRRIASAKGHLSNEDAAAVLRGLSGSLHLAILAHLSEENNEPDLAATVAQDGLSLYAENVEIFAASSVDRATKPAIWKQSGSPRERCTDDCWKYQFNL
jgi:phosphoribosyl 1,2-cyclic phosphodiesterase